MLSPDSISHGVVKPCRSRRSKSKNISIKQWDGTLLPLAIASLYLGRFGAQLAVEATGAPVGVEQPEQVERNEGVGERGHEVVGREIALDDDLANVAPGGTEHEERPADGRRQPEAAAEEHA